ncbi:uncharacterized protein V1518DRAFT_415609 [Limtongia smithiae]|uniref:uncharacterized protein n=1 Tax=Limtongia smithiae TaxID=1125753 RepID=UPI0034CE8247
MMVVDRRWMGELGGRRRRGWCRRGATWLAVLGIVVAVHILLLFVVVLILVIVVLSSSVIDGGLRGDAAAGVHTTVVAAGVGRRKCGGPRVGMAVAEPGHEHRGGDVGAVLIGLGLRRECGAGRGSGNSDASGSTRGHRGRGRRDLCMDCPDMTEKQVAADKGAAAAVALEGTLLCVGALVAVLVL